MSIIFHERQEGSLCAVHALNALLQGEYFTAVDLATLAHQLDDQERQTMAESGINGRDYLNFISNPSQNMDDSGFFSVQVLEKALKVWSLDLIPYNSNCDISQHVRANPTTSAAYIANYREHWFTIRRFGPHWFNLNSLLNEPELISDTFLSLFLAQLQQEGYSIFIVNGFLPSCDADRVLPDLPKNEVETFLKLVQESQS